MLQFIPVRVDQSWKNLIAFDWFISNFWRWINAFILIFFMEISIYCRSALTAIAFAYK